MNNVVDDSKEKFNKQIEYLKGELNKIRTGRANAQVLDEVIVNAYGVNSPLKQLASISVSDAKTMIIEPWDKSIIKDVEKAISKNNMGLNVANEGSFLRVVVPALTEESRKEIIKILKQKVEQCRINIRQVRDEVRDKIVEMEKNRACSEDDKYMWQKKLDEFINKINQEIKDLAEKKETEIMTI